MTEIEPGSLTLSDVGTTGLLTALSHAIESRSRTPLLRDPEAEAIAARLTPMLATSPSKVLRRLARGSIRSNLVVHLAIRARKYDEYARDFAARHRGACCQSRCGWPPSGYRRRACRRLDSNELHARHSCRSATESPHRLSVSLRAEDPWPAAPRLPFLGRGTMYLGAGLGWSSRTGSSRD